MVARLWPDADSPRAIIVIPEIFGVNAGIRKKCDDWAAEGYTEALKTEIVQAKPAQVVMLNSCFQGTKADELLSNLQLELAGLEIGLTVI